MAAQLIFALCAGESLNSIKPLLVYDPDRPDGQLSLTANAFNQLGQSRYQGLLLCRTHRFFHDRRQYSLRLRRTDGEVELARVAGYIARWFTPDGCQSPIPVLTGLNVEQLH